ncbi:hypothetical protein DSL92_00465 [Billgrantia gudaonensis]|uniref:Uncharacterized protein n=1 Tax=Billgrantia gudaonensis TaxID=376427 RepID=A0A432JKW8_9GAMM|nr:hypothetical protein DSL92_00465 [Halomonas gudaonensis]
MPTAARNSMRRPAPRVLRWQFVTIPTTIPAGPRTLWDKFGYPEPFPEYGFDLSAWWVDTQREAVIDQRLHGR